MATNSEDYLDFDISRDLESKPRVPPWLDEILEDIRKGLYKGFILYGSVEDLFPCRGSLVNLESYLLDAVTSRVVVGADPALGVYALAGTDLAEGFLTEKHRGPGVKVLNTFLQDVYNSRREFQGTIILNGGGYWLKDVGDAFTPLLVQRIVESVSPLAESLTVFIITPRLSDIHSLLVTSTYFKKVEVPNPGQETLYEALKGYQASHPTTFSALGNLEAAAKVLCGVGVHRLNQLVSTSVARQTKITIDSLEKVKQTLVEETCEGLIEFLNPTMTLDDLHGHAHLKQIIRRDIEFWNSGSLQLVPKGYLLAGPVGTGKTYFVEALAGEASVPVVKLNNFRTDSPGGTEANLEKIFRMLRSLSRCFVFIDEADQAMGSRQSGTDGTAGRIYSLFAQEIASERNRGKIVWIMATSQPHKLEPDLKRPGRIDLKIPLLPAETAEEAWRLIRAIANRKGVNLEDPVIPETNFSGREQLAAENRYILAAMPKWLTPASATVIVDEIGRRMLERPDVKPREFLLVALRDYIPLIPLSIMQEQSRLAVRESSDLKFVPMEYQYLAEVEKPYIQL